MPLFSTPSPEVVGPAPRPSLCSTHHFGVLGVLVVLLLTNAGCLNSLVMAGKVLMGDPQQPSAFEMVTGKSLQKLDAAVLVHVTATANVTDGFGTLPADLQLELISRMKRRGISVLHADAAADIVNRDGGRFDPLRVAREIDDCEYLAHVQVDGFTWKENSSPNLYRGRSNGRITVYEVRGGDGEKRHAVQVFEQQFRTEYPTTHPVPVDQTPKSVFLRRCVDHMADSIGPTFYAMGTADLFSL